MNGYNVSLWYLIESLGTKKIERISGKRSTFETKYLCLVNIKP